MAAVKSPDVAFIVMMAGPGTSFGDFGHHRVVAAVSASPVTVFRARCRQANHSLFFRFSITKITGDLRLTGKSLASQSMAYGFFYPTTMNLLDENGFSLKKDETLKLLSRVVIHGGTTDQAGIKGLYEEWSESVSK